MVAGASNAALSISRAWNELKRDIYNVVNSILEAVEPLASKLPGFLRSGFEQLSAEVKQKLKDVEQNISSLEASMAKNSEKINQSITTIKDTWGKMPKTQVNRKRTWQRTSGNLKLVQGLWLTQYQGALTKQD